MSQFAQTSQKNNGNQPHTPPVKWAQSSESIYLTISVTNISNPEVEITQKKVVIRFESESKTYKSDLDLFSDVVNEGSSWLVSSGSLQIKMSKKDPNSNFWPRLLFNKALEKNQVWVDWDRYIEEDEFDISDEILNMDALIREIEEDAMDTEEVIANVEYLSLFSDTSLNHLDKVFDSLFVDSELIVTPDNFVPHNMAIRPPMWNEIRSKRLLLEEYIYRLEGVPEEVIELNRENAVVLEDDVMVSEILRFGRLLNLSALTTKGGIEKAALAITVDNFLPDDLDVRPPAWKPIRLRRVIAKEMLQSSSGKGSAGAVTDYNELVLTRPLRVMQEEEIMLSEVMAYGKLLSTGSPVENKLEIEHLLEKKQLEQGDAQFDLIRERAMTMSNRATSTRQRAATLKDKNSQMNRQRSQTAAMVGMSEDEREFHQLLMKRVLIREQIERQKGVNEDAIGMNRNKKINEERKRMNEEMRQHGHYVHVTVANASATGPTAASAAAPAAGGRKRSGTLSQDISQLDLISYGNGDFNPGNPAKRHPDWAEIKLKRVGLKEHLERIGGVIETEIINHRDSKLIDEEMVMIGELLCYGRLLNVGENPFSVTSTAAVVTIKDKGTPKWATLKSQRIMLKELEDRLKKVPEAEIAKKRVDRDKAEELMMIAEAEDKGAVSPIGTREGSGSSGVSKPQKVQKIEITAKDFDPADPDKKPNGWAEVKLRKVYMKEWQDRRDGLDEDEIMAKRYERELEAEEEMGRDLSVFGIIKMFETRIQKNKK